MTDTTAAINPAATDHLPIFITQPGDTDVLFVVTSILLILIIVAIGLLYWRLHALPEQLAHRGEKIQFQFVALLTLVSLFTHNHAFWIAALLLAFVRFPDFSSPLTAMARSLSKMAGLPYAEAARPHAEEPESGEATEAHTTSPTPEPGPHDPHGPREKHGG